mmetsp:Transcript_8153/g.26256  ORF Transcript_8153/g.26256 Transcript_8153/m.26256 type:complete len:299 (+) Transcript_8153:94-990(+)
MRPKAGRHRSAPSRGFTRQARHLTRRAASQLVLLEGRRHAVVAREGGRAPAAPAELLEAGRVGCEVAEVAVVRVAQAALVGRGRLAQVRLPVDVAWRGAVPRILVPDDEVVALATGDVVGAVPPRAEVEKRASSLVRVRSVELAVRRRARVAAHGQRGACAMGPRAGLGCGPQPCTPSTAWVGGARRRRITVEDGRTQRIGCRLECSSGHTAVSVFRIWFAAPRKSLPRQTLTVTSESSVCMSRPRSCPALYLTMKEWCDVNPPSACSGYRSAARGCSTAACSRSIAGRIPMALTMMP